MEELAGRTQLESRRAFHAEFLEECRMEFKMASLLATQTDSQEEFLVEFRYLEILLMADRPKNMRRGCFCNRMNPHD